MSKYKSCAFKEEFLTDSSLLEFEQDKCQTIRRLVCCIAFTGGGNPVKIDDLPDDVSCMWSLWMALNKAILPDMEKAGIVGFMDGDQVYLPKYDQWFVRKEKDRKVDNEKQYEEMILKLVEDNLPSFVVPGGELHKIIVEYWRDYRVKAFLHPTAFTRKTKPVNSDRAIKAWMGDLYTFDKYQREYTTKERISMVKRSLDREWISLYQPEFEILETQPKENLKSFKGDW